MQSITGRAAFLALLADEGVEYLFGNPGTTELPVMDALPGRADITYVLGLQEAAVVAMADGYGRASGRLAACNVHVMPGLGNAMGSLFNASFIGSPVLLTAGQQEQGHGLMEPMLYGPMLATVTPLVKWAIEVTRLRDLPRIMRRAAKVATTPPTGPVFISLPGDILNDEAPLDLGRRTRIDTIARPADAALARVAGRLLEARAPVIICGDEVASSDAFAEAVRLAELLGAPVYQQTVPYGAHFPSQHAAFMGSLPRNQQVVSETLAAHDLLVAIGGDVLRMSVWSETEALPAGMPIVHIGQRDWDMGKNFGAEIALRADVGATLGALNPLIESERGAARAERAAKTLADLAARNWSAQRAALRDKLLDDAPAAPIEPLYLMHRIVEALPEHAVLVDEGLTSSTQLLKLYPLRDRHAYFGLASGGIGFAIAGAIGIHLALPDRPMVAVIGDGSAMYSIQALWTAAHLKLPITYVIANNLGYEILKNRIAAWYGANRFIGMEFEDPTIDFVALAQSMGVAAERITDPNAIGPALEASIGSGAPRLLDVMLK